MPQPATPLTAALAVTAGRPVVLERIPRGSSAQTPRAALLRPSPLGAPCRIAARRQRPSSGTQCTRASTALLPFLVLAGALLALLPPPTLRLQSFQPLPLQLTKLLGCGMSGNKTWTAGASAGTPAGESTTRQACSPGMELLARRTQQGRCVVSCGGAVAAHGKQRQEMWTAASHASTLRSTLEQAHPLSSSACPTCERALPRLGLGLEHQLPGQQVKGLVILSVRLVVAAGQGSMEGTEQAGGQHGGQAGKQAGLWAATLTVASMPAFLPVRRAASQNANAHRFSPFLRMRPSSARSPSRALQGDEREKWGVSG